MKRHLTFNFVSGINVGSFTAGAVAQVLIQTPPAGYSRMTPDQARELADAIRCAAAVAEYWSAPNACIPAKG